MVGKKMTYSDSMTVQNRRTGTEACWLFPFSRKFLKIGAMCCNLSPSLSQRISARCLGRPRDKSLLEGSPKDKLISNRRCTLTSILFLSWWQNYNKKPPQNYPKWISAHVALKRFQQSKIRRNIDLITKKKKKIHNNFQLMYLIRCKRKPNNQKHGTDRH